MSAFRSHPPRTGQAHGPGQNHPSVSGGGQARLSRFPPGARAQRPALPRPGGLFSRRTHGAGPRPLGAGAAGSARTLREARQGGRPLLRGLATAPAQAGLCRSATAQEIRTRGRPQEKGRRLGLAQPAPGPNGPNGGEGCSHGPGETRAIRPGRSAPFPLPPGVRTAARRGGGALTMLPAAVSVTSGTPPAPCPLRPRPARQLPPPGAPRCRHSRDGRGDGRARRGLAEGAASAGRQWERRAPRRALAAAPPVRAVPAAAAAGAPAAEASPPLSAPPNPGRKREQLLRVLAARRGKGGSSLAHGGGFAAGAAPQGMVDRRRAGSPDCCRTPVNSARPPSGLPRER